MKILIAESRNLALTSKTDKLCFKILEQHIAKVRFKLVMIILQSEDDF